MGTSTNHMPWTIPPEALAEWLRLSAELDAAGTVPCRECDPRAWWPDRKDVDGPAARMALDACSACPPRRACLAYALAADERFGIWGGTLPAERTALRL